MLIARSPKDNKIHGKISSAELRAAFRRVYMMRTIHVRAAKDRKSWLVAKLQPQYPSRAFRTKVEAVKYANELAQQENWDVIIYARDGRMLKSRRHGLL
ncbi:MAG: DUF2188 domain-containing protein [Candidatus Sumerlaeota bacterium]|nr:DUF2188 domain-containing protein [Candidatus Sumerlaeota bacterium]